MTGQSVYSNILEFFHLLALWQYTKFVNDLLGLLFLLLLMFLFENKDARELYIKSITVSKYYSFSFFLTLLNYLQHLFFVFCYTR